jgi:LytS/YehU family sensor histidine kinase
MSARIPTLMLQPLVENAVRHGILEREQGGEVQIHVRRLGDELIVSVEDDGDSPPPKELKFGVGLSNTSERLAALYGPQAHLDIAQGERGGYRVTVTLPYSADLEPQAQTKFREGALPA